MMFYNYQDVLILILEIKLLVVFYRFMFCQKALKSHRSHHNSQPEGGHEISSLFLSLERQSIPRAKIVFLSVSYEKCTHTLKIYCFFQKHLIIYILFLGSAQ